MSHQMIRKEKEISAFTKYLLYVYPWWVLWGINAREGVGFTFKESMCQAGLRQQGQGKTRGLDVKPLGAE